MGGSGELVEEAPRQRQQPESTKNVEAGAQQAAKDLFSGAVGGIAQVLIGQPFDIVKVRLQTTNQYPSALSAATSIYRHEGLSAFYKGTLTPLLSIGACVSVQFGAFHAARRWLEARQSETQRRALGNRLPYTQYFAAGAAAGIANAALAAPIEHVRIRLQSQPHGEGSRLYAGPLDCARKLAAAHPRGLIPAIYRGISVTIAREAAAYGAWFTTFEYLVRADAARNNTDRGSVPTWKVALYGGIAGEALWLVSYPLDVVKSKMQTDAPDPARRTYASTGACVGETWRSQGVAGFWRGIGPTLLRAMPVSAGTFAVVELTRRTMG